MTIERREFLALAGAAAAAPIIPAFAGPTASGPTLLDDAAEAMLREYPENATSLGIDNGARRALKARLTDRSCVAVERRAAAAAARLAGLRDLEMRARMTPAAARNVAVVRTAHELAVEGYKFGFGDVANLNWDYSYRNSPYVVAQNTGAVYETPDFLDSKHAVESRADANAYLSRLTDYARAIDGETERLRADRGKGVVAPSFLLDKTLKQHRAVRATPAAQSTLVTSLAKRASKFGDYGRRAEAIVTRAVEPALDRQIAELERHRARATDDAGVWHVPQGDAFYAWALRAGTTTRLTPDQVHAQGLAELKDLQARMDVLLRARGLTQGTVGARMTALGRDPKQLFPNTDTGRAQILAYIAEKIADIRPRLPRAFATLVPGKLTVKRVPVEIEAGAPGGYAGPGSLDGKQPGSYYINLRDTVIWPRHALPTLTYHEGLPGHVWQGEYREGLPLARSLLAFNAYSEGWALYAEQIADELGVYDNDPLGRLGMLQSFAFRACRLVVDTGLHAKRWTRDHAIKWFAETNGSTTQQVTGEVDRYCAWPGQACGYKIGHSEIVRLRAKAQAALGTRYDWRLFNDAVVTTGAVPLTMLEDVIDTHIAAG